MRLLKWLGVQFWKHPLLSSIVAVVAVIMASSGPRLRYPGTVRLSIA